MWGGEVNGVKLLLGSEENWSVFYKMTLNWDSSFFLMIRLEVSVLERRNAQSHFPHVKGDLPSTWLIAVDVNRAYPPEVMFVKFPHCEITLCLLSILYFFFKENDYVWFTLKEWELISTSLKVEYLCKLFGIFVHGRFFFFSPIYLFIYLHQSGLVDILDFGL